MHRAVHAAFASCLLAAGIAQPASTLTAAEVQPDRWVVALDEEFDGAALNESYQWVRPQADGFKLADGKLLLKAVPGTLAAGDAAKAPLFLFHPADAFQAAYNVIIDPAGLSASEELGLVLYCDDDNYVKVSWLRRDGKPAVVATRVFKGEAKEEGVATDIPEGRIKLRLERDIFRVFAFAQPLGGEEQWVSVAQTRVAGRPPLWAAIYGTGQGSDGNWIGIEKAIAFKPRPLAPGEVPPSPTDINIKGVNVKPKE